MRLFIKHRILRPLNASEARNRTKMGEKSHRNIPSHYYNIQSDRIIILIVNCSVEKKTNIKLMAIFHHGVRYSHHVISEWSSRGAKMIIRPQFPEGN